MPWNRLIVLARRTGLGLLTCYGVALLAGVVHFAAHRPAIVTPALGTAPRAGELTNLASAYNGATLTVSSFDGFNRHHPLYAIDGRPGTGSANPGKVEKWVRAASDLQPWLELQLPRPSRLRQVTLSFTAAFEKEVPAAAAYTITCLPKDASHGVNSPPNLDIRGNREAVRSHLLDCPGTDRLRLGFPEPAARPEVTGLYEVEVLGEVEP